MARKLQREAEPVWFSLKDSAIRLNVCEDTLRSYILNGLLAAHRLPGGAYRIRVADLEELLEPAGPEGAGGSPQPNWSRRSRKWSQPAIG